MEQENKKKRLIIIDSNSVIHRAYHALPSLTTKEGELVNAVYGFLLVFLKVIKEFQPDYIAAAFDVKGPTFRHQKYKQYKAKRPPTPKELYDQIPRVKEVLKNFNVPIFEKSGYEADDIIGTISELAPKKENLPKIEIIILSGDLDIWQLINQNTKVYFLNKGVKQTILCDEKQVKEKYDGLKPKQLNDLRALRGDPSDNIPGVAGIGEKTAIKLIKEFGSLENLYQCLEKKDEQIQKMPPKTKELLIQYKEQAFLSQMLSRIKKDVLIDFNLPQCLWKDYNKEKVISLLEKYNFKSLITQLNANQQGNLFL